MRLQYFKFPSLFFKFWNSCVRKRKAYPLTPGSWPGAQSHSVLLRNITNFIEHWPQTRPFWDLVQDRSRETQDLSMIMSEHRQKYEHCPCHKNDQRTPPRLVWVTAASLPTTALVLLPSFSHRDCWLRYLITEFPPLPDSIHSRAMPSSLNPPQIT